MKIACSKTLALLAMTTVLLTTACGGGNDDDAGSPTAFSTVPSGITFSGAVTDTCPGGGGIADFFIFGGAAPYQIRNTSPDLMSINKTSVGDRGGSFRVTTLGGGCPSKGTVVVIDNLNNLVTVEVSFAKGE
jgi:hypothetical protein